MKRLVHGGRRNVERVRRIWHLLLCLHSATGSESVYVRLGDESGQKWDYNLGPAMRVGLTHRIMIGFDLAELYGCRKLGVRISRKAGRAKSAEQVHVSFSLSLSGIRYTYKRRVAGCSRFSTVSDRRYETDMLLL